MKRQGIDPPDGRAKRKPAPQDDIPEPSPVAVEEGRTDSANALRFARLYRDELRYVHAWRKWLAWDGGAWVPDDAETVVQLAGKVADSVFTEARKAGGQEAIRFASRTAGESGLRAMVRLAQPRLAIAPDKLDSHPWLLNCRNGTIDLRTGKLHPHAREQYLTKQCPVKFNPAATAPTWESFLGRIFAGDGGATLAGYVRRWVGYAVTGSVEEQVLPIFHGCGANGKSTLLNTLLAMLGPDFAMQAPANLLITRKHDPHPTELADLHGKRLVVASETDHGRRISESRAKDLTGGERIRARRMKEDFWEFAPSHKLVLSTNARPQVVGTDHGIWRRLKLIPFQAVIPDHEQDKRLPEKLREELPGILAWAVRGCLEWQASGLAEPSIVQAETAEYRASEDLIGTFLDEQCEMIDGATVKASELRSAVLEWWKASGATKPAPSAKALGTELRGRGFDKSTSNGVLYHGLRLCA